MEDKNVYQPYLMRIAAAIQETPDVKTFRLEFINEEEGKKFNFKAGQFGEYSVFGEGESTFCPGCGRAVIQRRGFQVVLNEAGAGHCAHCGATVHGVGL